MSELNPHQESSMEEILASIRRIISEDDDGAQEATPSSAAASNAAPVFTLTQRAEQGATASVTSEDHDMVIARNIGIEAIETPKPTFTLNFDDVIEASSTEDEASSAETFSLSNSGAKMGSVSSAEEKLISPGTASAATQVLARLKDLDKEEESPVAAVIRASGGGSPTLHDLVQEALKPMLRDWIDQNLVSIVETLVAKEIQRLVDSIRRS